MTTALLIITGPTLIWAICHRRLRRLSINGPVFMVIVGGVIGAFTQSESTAFFDSKLALYGAQIILALLLFVFCSSTRPTAYNALPTNDGNAVLAATCIIIVASLALHGFASGPLTTYLYRRSPAVGQPAVSDSR